MENWKMSAELLKRNEQWIPGGVVSLNRKATPDICFKKGKGSRVWDIDGNGYIDYQAGFSAAFLGHNDPDVDQAVTEAITNKSILMGAGPTELEGEFAEFFCSCVPTVDKIEITTTGSEATYHAIRIARAVTGKDHIVKIQGGYNGWHNDVAANTISAFNDVGPRVSPGEYPFDALSAGIPDCHKALIHIVNFNDIASALFVIKKYPVACIIIEPVLQNIGVVKPAEGYLQSLRILADEYGFLLVFDEVKTGFRHALQGYQGICGVIPDLSTFGKAIANGYPMGVIAGKKKYMDYFIHPEKSRRALVAGTYNAHPLTTVAAIATLRKLSLSSYRVYEHVYELGKILEEELTQIFRKYDEPFHIARLGSALCIYFMDHAPIDFHDILLNHNFDLDKAFRLQMIKNGIYMFPLPIKQVSISFAHNLEDVDETISKALRVTETLFAKKNNK